MQSFSFRTPFLAGALLVGASLASCSTGGRSAGQAGVVGTETLKPGSTTETFFVDENQSGRASSVRIAEMFWGRLVNVHDVFQDASGAVTGVDETPVFEEFVINDIIQSDGTNYVLETNPITQNTRLIIQRERGRDPALPGPTGTFDELLRTASSSLPPIAAFGDTPELIGNTLNEPSLLARNAALVVRFDDMMDDSAEAVAELPQTVKVLTGYPPITPFAPRMFFDPNHGGVVDGAFHSTRLIVDMTVSAEEAANLPGNVPINSLGLPSSIEVAGNTEPNVSIRIPTRRDVASGQFELLRNMRGSVLATGSANAPVDDEESTVEVVRAMRSGRSLDDNNGFLSDLNPPQVVGNWSLTVDSATQDPTSILDPGFDFVLSVTFTTPCQAGPEEGDILSVNDEFLEVREPASDPDNNGQVSDLRVRLLSDTPIMSTVELLGLGLFQSTYDPTVPVAAGCWVNFTPSPGEFPSSEISPMALIRVRFTEPMDPTTVLPFDSFSVIRGSVDSEPSATNTVVGEVRPSADLREFTFAPVLPFAHQQAADQYHVELLSEDGGVTDLAGNALRDELPFVLFSINPAAAPEANGSIVLRFNATDEFQDGAAAGFNDLRGQFFYDFSRGIIRPRPVTFSSVAIDRSNPIPSIMIPFPPGVQTPLVPLGAKMHTVWRYADAGWLLEDETKQNVDVVGLSWSPAGGQVVADFYEEFEIRLAHGFRLPDEYINSALLPVYTASGLIGGARRYENNLLDAMDQTVHPRSLGYQVNPADLTQNGNQTFLMPFPWNQGLDIDDPNYETFTWRDTSILSRGGPNGAGVPMDREFGFPIDIDGNFDPTGQRGGLPPCGSCGRRVYSSGDVPTIGLPLLMDFRCYPSDSGIGLNAFDISLAINSSVRPNFRSFSQGGFDATGTAVIVDPDTEDSPSGGFNPSNGGMPTQFNADNTFYIGEMDIVSRISRAHTIWLDTGIANPDFQDPVVEPIDSIQPLGTSVARDFRGATSFDLGAGDEPFNALTVDAYGDPDSGRSNVNFLNGENQWFSDIDSIDGAQYVQVRLTFFSNIATTLTPEFSAIGVAFDTGN